MLAYFSAALVHYYLASFLVYKSPHSFQAPELLWSWVLIIKYAFEEIADVLGKKKVRFVDLEYNKRKVTYNDYDSFHPVHVVSTEELGRICSNLQTILIFLGFFK